MSYIPSQAFWGPDGLSKARRCLCKYHSDVLGRDVWCSTAWKRLDHGTGTERYEVTATASDYACHADHGGQTDTRIITKVQWENASANAKWDFFPNLL